MHHISDGFVICSARRRIAGMGWNPVRFYCVASRHEMDSGNEWGWHMDAIGLLKSWIGALTDIGLMLLALAIVASLLVGGTLPFFGGVVGNIVSMVKDLGSNGLVGLIAVGIIMWLFSARRVA